MNASSHAYNQGDACGPSMSRSTTLKVNCNMFEFPFAVRNVVETQTCQYSMELDLPIPCWVLETEYEEYLGELLVSESSPVGLQQQQPDTAAATIELSSSDVVNPVATSDHAIVDEGLMDSSTIISPAISSFGESVISEQRDHADSGSQGSLGDANDFDDDWIFDTFDERDSKYKYNKRRGEIADAVNLQKMQYTVHNYVYIFLPTCHSYSMNFILRWNDFYFLSKIYKTKLYL